jgi:hypothetical protein
LTDHVLAGQVILKKPEFACNTSLLRALFICIRRSFAAGNMEIKMKNFDVQSIGLTVSAQAAFDYISQPANLPKWTNAFSRADATTAVLVTPNGEVPITLQTVTSREAGNVDWLMTFPDGSVASAYSRITANGADNSIYTFVLMAPPVPLEALEGALEAQKGILATELEKLKGILAA